ncbi:hypothetical protein PCL1606_35150 [Pseudomonas chlororaphis]|uniref:Uncharacterized protein n=1 Tax=Pseudomonas chlororaphis TaxID=587753 RepID=A0A0D5Y1U4_9PSED|nr:hypothetical protein PCL1606_35150 [Pseudomonas chlororaphis]
MQIGVDSCGLTHDKTPRHRIHGKDRHAPQRSAAPGYS